jgi:hypothetical protein
MPPLLRQSRDGEIAQVRLHWTLHQQECINVLHFKSFGVQAIETNLLDVIINCIQTTLLPGLSAQLTLNRVHYRSMVPDETVETERLVVANNIGGDANVSIPTTDAAVITLKSLTAGRSGRGRMFVPGIPEDGQTNSRLNPALVAIIVQFLTCMAASFFIGDPPAAVRFDWGVFSRKLGGAVAPFSNAGFSSFTAYRANDIIGTMRSRRIGRGI